MKSKKKKLIIVISILTIVLTVVMVVLLTVDFVQTKELYLMTSRSHKVFANIDELDSIEGLKLIVAEKDVDIYGIIVSEKREYRYDDVTLSAYVVNDPTLTNKLLEVLIGENAATTFNLYEGFSGTMIASNVEYYVFSGKSLLIARTKSGAKMINDLVVALDNNLSVEVMSISDAIKVGNNAN